MILVLVFVWILVIISGLYLQNRNSGKKHVPIPGPVGFPIIGNVLTLWGKPEVVFKRLYALARIHSRMVGIWIGPKLHVAIWDAKDAEVLLRATVKRVGKADEYRFIRPWLGDSILTSTGAKFKKNRKLIMPAFHMNVLKSFLSTFNYHSRQLTKKLEVEVGKEEFDINDYLCAEAMNVLLETAMGVSNETLGQQATEYAHAVEKLCRYVHIRMYTLWLRPDFLFQFSSLRKKQDECLSVVHPLTERVIKRRRNQLILNREQTSETGEKDERKHTAFLDMLLEAQLDGHDLSDQEIMDEVLTMMFAGQDTTTGTTGFALSLLGLYHRVQDKVHEELDRIFEDDYTRDVTYEDVCQMEYIERVLQETLRLYPAIPLVAKKPMEDIELADGYILPKSCTVGIIIMQLHRNPNYYENPNLFNPDNFLPDKVKERHPYCFLPFSAGARTCVGPKYAMMKMKVILAHLLRAYKVYGTRKEKDFVLSAQTTLKRREGFLLRLEPRFPHKQPNLRSKTFNICEENDIDICGKIRSVSSIENLRER